MFHSDISFTSKEKAVQFGEDAKNFLISYREALAYVKERATNDAIRSEYLNNTKSFLEGLKRNTLTFGRFLGSAGKVNTLVPTFHSEDEKFRLAKYSYLVFREHFGDLKSLNTFEGINKKLDIVYDLLEKQSKL